MSKRKILIPLDGSDFSRQILSAICDWFDAQAATLVLLRVDTFSTLLPDPAAPHRFTSDMPTGGIYAAYSEEMHESRALTSQERKTILGELQRELQVDAERLRALGYTVSTEVHFGEPAQKIIDLASNGEIDLIAMTTHGRSGLARLAMGSVAERVLRGVNIPVVLQRPALSSAEAEPTPGALLAQSLSKPYTMRLAAATDGSTFGQKAVTQAIDLARQLKANLTLLVTASEHNPAEHNQQVMHDVAALVADLEPTPTIIPLVGYPEEVLLHYLEQNPQDLFVLGAFRDRGAGSAKTIGTTAQRLVQYAPGSVLMLKNHGAKINKLLVCGAADDDVAIDVGCRLARALDAELDLLHVVPPNAPPTAGAPVTQGDLPAQTVQTWAQQLESQGFKRANLQIQNGNPLELILKTAQAGAYNLVIVGSQSGAGHFLGSVANGVVRFAEQSVLVVRTRI